MTTTIAQACPTVAFIKYWATAITHYTSPWTAPSRWTWMVYTRVLRSAFSHQCLSVISSSTDMKSWRHS